MRLILLTLLALAPLPATAELIVVTYTGKVSINRFGDPYIDQTGIFIEPGGSLSHLPFTMTFCFDTSLGRRTTVPGKSDELVGGEQYGAATPLLVSELTINERTRSLKGVRLGSANLASEIKPGTGTYIGHHLRHPVENSSSGEDYESASMTIYGKSVVAPLSLDESFTLTGLSQIDGDPEVEAAYGIVHLYDCPNEGACTLTFLWLKPETLTVEVDRLAGPNAPEGCVPLIAMGRNGGRVTG
jgi:hypothetical protein